MTGSSDESRAGESEAPLSEATLASLTGLRFLEAFTKHVKREASVDLAFVARLDDADEQRLRCLLYTSPSPRDATLSRMPSSA